MQALPLHRLVAGVLLSLFSFGFVPLARAAEQTPNPASSSYLQYQEPVRASGSTMETMAYVLSLLFLFLGVILLAYLTSRFIATKMGKAGQSQGSSIHTTLALGPNRNIHLVEMAGRFFVVGATEQSIRKLFEIDSPEQITRIREGATVQKASFEEALGSQLQALKQIRERFPGVFSAPGNSSRSDDHAKK